MREIAPENKFPGIDVSLIAGVFYLHFLHFIAARLNIGINAI